MGGARENEEERGEDGKDKSRNGELSTRKQKMELK
tara:strand:- start:149 stop:253 length:105 start_codon:yes stop_codon:yes gene_type:complete